MSNVDNGRRARRKPNYLNQFKTEFRAHRRTPSTTIKVAPDIPEKNETPLVDSPIEKEVEQHLEIEDEKSSDSSEEFNSDDSSGYIAPVAPKSMCHNFFTTIKWLLNFR